MNGDTYVHVYKLYMMHTEIEEFLSGFIGIHVAVLEHSVNVFITVFSRDLLDILDRSPETIGNRNPRKAAHRFSDE